MPEIYDDKEILSDFTGDVKKEVNKALKQFDKYEWGIPSGIKIEYFGYQPNTVYVLGELAMIGIGYSMNGNKPILDIQSFDKHPPLLCADDNELLYIVDKYKSIDVKNLGSRNVDEEVKKAISNFKKFHWGTNVKRIHEFDYTKKPKSVVLIGTIALTGYATKKKGDRYSVLYVHSANNPPPLLVSDGSRLYIYGGGYTIEERGLIG